MSSSSFVNILYKDVASSKVKGVMFFIRRSYRNDDMCLASSLWTVWGGKRESGIFYRTPYWHPERKQIARRRHSQSKPIRGILRDADFDNGKKSSSTNLPPAEPCHPPWSGWYGNVSMHPYMGGVWKYTCPYMGIIYVFPYMHRVGWGRVWPTVMISWRVASITTKIPFKVTEIIVRLGLKSHVVSSW